MIFFKLNETLKYKKIYVLMAQGQVYKCEHLNSGNRTKICVLKYLYLSGNRTEICIFKYLYLSGNRTEICIII